MFATAVRKILDQRNVWKAYICNQMIQLSTTPGMFMAPALECTSHSLQIFTIMLLTIMVPLFRNADNSMMQRHTETFNYIAQTAFQGNTRCKTIHSSLTWIGSN